MFADGVGIVYTDSVRTHDRQIERNSQIDLMLSGLFVDNPEANLSTQNQRPAMGYGDSAYGSEHIYGYKTRAQLAHLPAAARDTASARHVATNDLRIVVEDSFNLCITHWPLLSRSRVLRLSAGGKNAWNAIKNTWMVALFFTNIHTCLNGSQINSCTGVDPPSVEDYLANHSRGLLEYTTVDQVTDFVV